MNLIIWLKRFLNRSSDHKCKKEMRYTLIFLTILICGCQFHGSRIVPDLKLPMIIQSKALYGHLNGGTYIYGFRDNTERWEFVSDSSYEPGDIIIISVKREANHE